MKEDKSEHKNINKDPDNPFRVLVIDDDKYIAKMIRLVLDELGIESDHVSDSNTAIRLAKQQNYTLTILDVHLGTEDGFELIHILKEFQPQLNFITMTGDNPRSVELRVRELKVLYHLVKPFAINELTSILEHFNKRHCGYLNPIA